jgi:hypothetical protein
VVLSQLMDSCSHGDNTRKGHWGLEYLLSSPWAPPADIRQSHNLSNRVGRSGAPSNPLKWLRLPQCISTTGRTLVVEGSASLPLQRGGIPARWSFAWRLASPLLRSQYGTVRLMYVFSSQRKRYMTIIPPTKTLSPPGLRSADCSDVAMMRHRLGTRIRQLPRQTLGHSDLPAESLGLALRGVEGVRRGPRNDNIVVYLYVCSKPKVTVPCRASFFFFFEVRFLTELIDGSGGTVCAPSFMCISVSYSGIIRRCSRLLGSHRLC